MTPFFRKRVSGKRLAILEHFKMRGDDPLIVAHVENWDDIFDRRGNAKIQYIRLREIGVKPKEAKAKVAALYNLDIRTVEALVRGSGRKKSKLGWPADPRKNCPDGCRDKTDVCSSTNPSIEEGNAGACQSEGPQRSATAFMRS